MKFYCSTTMMFHYDDGVVFCPQVYNDECPFRPVGRILRPLWRCFDRIR